MHDNYLVPSCNLCPIVNPIMIIQASITILKQSLDLDDDEKQRFEKIGRSIDRIFEHIKANKIIESK